MKIDTTINIKRLVLERIDEAASDSGVTRSLLISLLLKRMVQVRGTDKNRFSRVKYQKRDPKAGWKRPHVMLDYDLYEKCIDMRKLSKMSVSFLVQVSFNMFFEKVVDELNKGVRTDNNLRNYICIGKRYGEVCSYTVFWDFPPEEELKKFLE